MNYDKESFKAEVRRRGCERIAKRKRIRRQITVCVIPMFVCVIAAAVLVPRLWLGMSDEAADMLMENGTETIAPAYGLDGDENLEMSPPAGDMLPSEKADGDDCDDALDSEDPILEDEIGEMEELSFQSIELAVIGEVDSARLYTDEQILLDFQALYQSIIEKDREDAPDFVTGYRITITMYDQSVQECFWNGTSLYLPEEERSILLTDEENKALTALLLE